MNIQTAIKLLGPVPVDHLISLIPSPDQFTWDQGDFRNENLAGGAHTETRNLVRRHEWFNRDGVPDQTLDEAIDEWSANRQLSNRYLFSNCSLVATTSLCSVYEFSITPELNIAIDRCVLDSVRFIAKIGGVVIRSMITALPPGKVIQKHRDGGLMTRYAHRIHIPLQGAEGVIYRIGGKKVEMQAGYAYDFNNRWIHSVQNQSNHWRINLILDYLEDPTVTNPWAHLGWRP
jgi:hypothetical protein